MAHRKVGDLYIHKQGAKKYWTIICNEWIKIVSHGTFTSTAKAKGSGEAAARRLGIKVTLKEVPDEDTEANS